MDTCRVLIVSGHPLFAEGVFRLINNQAGLEVVSVIPPCEQTLDNIHSLKPDVVVVDVDARSQAVSLHDLIHGNPGVKFIGLSLDNNDIRVYYQHVKKSTGVEALVEAIREPLEWRLPEQPKLRILAITQGRYGQRIVENIRRYAPDHWQMQQWVVPTSLPSVLDDTHDFLPPMLPAADLILSLGESPSVALLLPDVVKMSGARGVIAPIDNAAWLPNELVNQLHEWLARMGVVIVAPKPFCSLTENEYNVGERRVRYVDGPIAEFARHFGRPAVRVNWAENNAQIGSVEVVRDSACGCTRYVAEKLSGVSAEQVQLQAGILHHHFPCLASMTIDADYNDALLNVSGHILQEVVKTDIESFCVSSQKAGAAPTPPIAGRGGPACCPQNIEKIPFCPAVTYAQPVEQ
jgi:hypothetical protein